MTAEQSITQAIMQALIDTAKAANVAIRKSENLVNNARPVHAAARSDGPVLRQPTFDWKVTNIYQEVCNFEIDIRNIFMTNS